MKIKISYEQTYTAEDEFDVTPDEYRMIQRGVIPQKYKTALLDKMMVSNRNVQEVYDFTELDSDQELQF